MTGSFRPDDPDDGPASEPSTLITKVSPALATAAEVAHAEDVQARSPMPSPVGDDAPIVTLAEHHTPGTPEAGAVKKPRAKMSLHIPDDEVPRPSKAVPSVPIPTISLHSQAPVPPSRTPSSRPGALPGHVSPPPPSASSGAVTAHRIITIKKADTPTKQMPVSALAAIVVDASTRSSSGESSSAPAPSPSSPIPPRPPSVALPPSGEDTEPHGRKVPLPPSRPPPRPPPGAEDSWTPFQPMAADRVAVDELAPDSSLSVDIAVDSTPFERGPAGAPLHATTPTEPSKHEAPRDIPRVALGAPPLPSTSSPPPPDPRPPPSPPAPAAASPSSPVIDPALDVAPKSGDAFPEMVFDDNLFNATAHAKDDHASPLSDRATLPLMKSPLEGTNGSAPQGYRPPVPSSPALLPSIVDGVTIDSDSVVSDPEPAVSSEPAEVAEISPEDVVSVEAVGDKPRPAAPSVPPPPMRARAPSVPSFPPLPPPPPPPAAPAAIKPARGSGPSLSTATIKTSVPPEHVRDSSPAPKPLIVPASSPLAPPPMTDSAQNARKRTRPWWEELFNDDFVRTMAKITDAQIAEEVDFIEESLGLNKGAMVLDLACGTGRHAIELTRRGYEVVGFDLSLSMLAKAADEAQDREQKLNFVQGDMREMTFDGTFDGVYCWSTSFGFFEEEKNAAVIANVRRALKPGGQVLLDVVNRDFIAQQAPSLVWFEGDGCVCMDDMNIDWITSRLKVKRTLMMDDGRSREIEYSIRLYALHELGKLLHENGFRVVQVSGRVATPGVFFGANSPRTLILAEKK